MSLATVACGSTRVRAARCAEAIGIRIPTILQGQTTASVKAGQAWMSERLGGAWLSRVRVAQDLLEVEAATRAQVVREMGNEEIDLLDYVHSNRRASAEVERMLLDGLTRTATNGNEWACDELRSIGAEMGTALAAFVWQFRDFEAVEHIALVSTIAEKLGKGVKATGSREDVLMDSLRESLGRH